MLTPSGVPTPAREGQTRILIGNDFSEDVRTDRGWTGWWVQRLIWFAEDHDILVLPGRPDDDFVEYVTARTGTCAETLRFVSPPVGRGGAGTLSPDRLAAEQLLTELRTTIGGRTVVHLSALWPDTAVARLACRLGIEAAMPGAEFVRQAGGLLMNSKSMFRAMAGGAGVPMPKGAVCTSRENAEEVINDLLDDDEPVVIKHDFLSGGRGNEILGTGGPVRPIGARRTVPIASPADVRSYLDENWAWLSSEGRGRPVVERYHPHSSAYFAEMMVGDHSAQVRGTGELLSAPYAVGQVMPAQGLPAEAEKALVDGALRLGEAVRAIGYRGVLSADAIVTPEQDVLFTEYNGRVTGSTHIYGRIGERLVGSGYGKDRMILERVWPPEWFTPSFATAHRTITKAGLAYDPATRQGVVFTNAFDGSGGVMYCIVAADRDSALTQDRALGTLFDRSKQD
jgi:hypothetical protein